MTEEFGMDEILAQQPEAKPGSIIEGTVVGLTDSHVLVNIGLKHEATLPVREFGGNLPAVGDVLSLLVIRLGGQDGRPLLSWRQARERKNWDVIAAAHEKNEIIEGRIVSKVKGGFNVDIGLDAFMPASQVDEKPVAKPDEWVGRTVQVQVIEMDRAKGNVLVSRRRLVEADKAVRRAQTLEGIKVGMVVEGTVTSLTSFGAFVDIGGIEGLLHVSDIAWNRVDKPETVLKPGDKVEVKILKFDATSNRISLGRKQLMAHPWEGIETRYPIGSTVKGKVSGLAEFGAFVELEPGVEGLIHISELSWTERVKRPHGLVKVGQEVDVKLIGIDREKEKISLSLRRTGVSPWEQAAKQHPVGSKVEGEVTHIAQFGAFIKIPAGVEALLKTQDISWTERIASPSQVLKVGDKITAVVLEVNAAQEKMSLGMKQLTADPMRSLRIGQEVTGTVGKTTEFGVFVKLEGGFEGLIRNSEMTNERSMFGERRDRREPVELPKFTEGEAITASVIKINKADRKVELSIRRYEREQERDLLKKYSGNNFRPTLGEATGWDQSFEK